jgi:hypothetical protein
MVRIIAISPPACDDLLSTQASQHAGAAIGRHGVLPVTEAVWQDYYQRQIPSIDQPWWTKRQITAETFDGIMFIDPSLPVFAGHFPDNPILPGIVQIDWAVTAAQEAFEQTPENRFRGMSQIKFKAPVPPGSWLRLTLSLAAGHVDFAYADGSSSRTQGRLQYDA